MVVRRIIWILLSLVLALSAAPLLRSENWPQWRGPFHNGSTSETNLPFSSWKRDQVAWATPLPGKSGATPVIWEDSIFLPSPDARKNLHLFCLDRPTGKVRWQVQVASGDRVMGKNNMASPSAITDGQRVYILFGTGDFMAFDFQGGKIWERRLSDDYGAFAHLFLYGASPLLFENSLYVPILQRNPPTYGHAKDDKPDRQSWLICIDPATGRTRWAQPRVTTAREEAMEAYTTPIPFLRPDGAQIILSGADCVTSHHPQSGAELWRFAGLNLSKNPGGRIVPSPVTTPTHAIVTGPKREKLVSLRIGNSDAPRDVQVAWETKQYIPDVSTPLFYQGKLFVLDGDRQTMICYEPASGQKVWQGRLGIREIFYSSPTAADNKIFCLSEDGTLVVLSAGNQFEVIATLAFEEGPCMASVPLSQGRLFIRTSKNLYCLQGDKKEP